MNDTPERRVDLFKVGFLFELSLVGVAAVIGWIARSHPFPFELRLDLHGLGIGLAATIPPALFAVVATTKVGSSLPPLRAIHDRLKDVLGPRILRMNALEILLLSGAAGIGEEILFRGVLQDLLGDGYRGILLASILFGLLHALTATYFALATLIGIYFGWLYVETNNLFVPIVVHWAYDTIALALFRRRFAREESELAEASDAADIAAGGAPAGDGSPADPNEPGSD